MRTYKLEQFEELKTEFDRISENGRKNPEEVLEAFKTSIRPWRFVLLRTLR